MQQVPAGAVQYLQVELMNTEKDSEHFLNFYCAKCKAILTAARDVHQIYRNSVWSRGARNVFTGKEQWNQYKKEKTFAAHCQRCKARLGDFFPEKNMYKFWYIGNHGANQLVCLPALPLLLFDSAVLRHRPLDPRDARPFPRFGDTATAKLELEKEMAAEMNLPQDRETLNDLKYAQIRDHATKEAIRVKQQYEQKLKETHISGTERPPNSPGPAVAVIPVSPLDQTVLQELHRYAIPFAQLTLGDVLGYGSYGIVRKVFHAKSASIYAAKVMKGFRTDDDRVLFQSEVDMMSSLRHPQVLQFIGVSKEPNTGNLMLLSEYMEGGSLNKRLHSPGGPDPGLHRPQVAIDIATGLSYLHSKSVIHRDIKSENVLLDTQGMRAKIADFGEAKFCGDSASLDTVVGTALYLAPEMLAAVPYTSAVDVYSFGLLLWELYTAQRPYSTRYQRDIAALKVHVLEGNRPDLALPVVARLAPLLAKCWHADGLQRPQMAAVVNDLRCLLAP